MSKLRQDADAIIQAAITAAQPDEAVRKALEGRDFGSGRVVLVAAGKGAWQMANAASRILGSRIDTGIVITKYDHSKGPIANFTIREAGRTSCLVMGTSPLWKASSGKPGTPSRTRTALPPPSRRWTSSAG